MNHQWVAITVVPVEVMPPPKRGDVLEDPIVMPHTASVDGHDTKYGCNSCGQPLNSETYYSSCAIDNSSPST